MIQWYRSTFNYSSCPLILHLASTMCLVKHQLGDTIMIFFLTEVVPKNAGKRKHRSHIMPAKQTGSLTPQYNAIVSCFVLSVSSLSSLYLTRQYCTGQDQSSHVSSLLAHVSVLILPFFLVKTLTRLLLVYWHITPSSPRTMSVHASAPSCQDALFHAIFSLEIHFKRPSTAFLPAGTAPSASMAAVPVTTSGVIGAWSGCSRKRLASTPQPSAKTRPPLAEVQHKVNRVSQPDFKLQNNWEIWLSAPSFQIQNMEASRIKNLLWILRPFGCQMDSSQLTLERKCSDIVILIS